MDFPRFDGQTRNCQKKPEKGPIRDFTVCSIRCGYRAELILGRYLSSKGCFPWYVFFTALVLYVRKISRSFGGIWHSFGGTAYWTVCNRCLQVASPLVNTKTMNDVLVSSLRSADDITRERRRECLEA